MENHVHRYARLGTQVVIKETWYKAMTRFFFNVTIGDRSSADTEGSVIEKLSDVRDEAISILPGLADDALPDGDNRVFAVEVTTEDGQLVMKASLTLHAEWLGEFKTEEARQLFQELHSNIVEFTRKRPGRKSPLSKP